MTQKPGDSLTLTVMWTEQRGDVGVVTIDRSVGLGKVPGGTFDSAELLAWVEAMATRPGLERIPELRLH